MAEAKRTFDIVVSKPQSLTGGITVAPLNTPIPATFTQKLDKAKFTELGYVSEDGVTLSEDTSDEDIKVWGGVKVRTVRSDYSAKVAFTMHSTGDLDALKAVFGENNVKKTGDVISVTHGADMTPVQVFTIETVDPNNGYQRRFAIPRGQLTISGDRKLTHSAADGFEVTIECLADPETGVCYTEYTLVPSTALAA